MGNGPRVIAGVEQRPRLTAPRSDLIQAAARGKYNSLAVRTPRTAQEEVPRSTTLSGQIAELKRAAAFDGDALQHVARGADGKA